MCGAQAGFNFVFDNGLMLGVEGDYAFAVASMTTEASRNRLLQSHHVDLEIDQAGVGQRPGWAWQWGNGFHSSRLAGAGPRPTVQPSIHSVGTSSDSNWHDGWTAGLGAEYAIDERWSVKAEYRYYDLGKENYGVAALGGEGTDVDLDLHTVLVGINLHW